MTCKIDTDRGEDLADLVVQLAGEVTALLLLDFDHAAGEDLQAFRRLAQGLLGPLALGDVTVDRIDLNLSAGYRDRHADHGNVQTAAILAPANALHIHALPLRHQVRVSLLLILATRRVRSARRGGGRGSLAECSQKRE